MGCSKGWGSLLAFILLPKSHHAENLTRVQRGAGFLVSYVPNTSTCPIFQSHCCGLCFCSRPAGSPRPPHGLPPDSSVWLPRAKAQPGVLREALDFPHPTLLRSKSPETPLGKKCPTDMCLLRSAGRGHRLSSSVSWVPPKQKTTRPQPTHSAGLT